MTRMDIERLLTPHLPEADVDIPGVGVVRVRGMSRWEAFVMRAIDTEDDRAREQAILSWCMVDPPMTEDQVAAWLRASPATEIEPITDRIAALSGMKPGAQKKVMKELLSEDSDAEFRDVPSPETRDDGSSPAGGNVS